MPSMRSTLFAVAVLAFLLAGCYRVTVDTGAPQAPRAVDRPWQLSLAAGLVPPPELDVSEECPAGVARVQTQRSFLNQLAAAVTSSIITPMHATVICAQGPGQRSSVP